MERPIGISLTSRYGRPVSVLLLALIMAASQLTGVVAQDEASDAQTLETVVLSDAEAATAIAQIDTFVADVVLDLEEFESDRMRSDIVVDALDWDPESILDWVTGETRWVPYQGVLRGSRGVLMDRTGNSLDRALLLADLLESAGLDVRLARTRLPMSAAAALVDIELARPLLMEDDLLGKPEEVEDYRTSVASSASELADMLGFSADDQSAGSLASAAEAMADHWWVQAVLGPDWVDFDPLFGDDPGQRPEAEEVMADTELPVELRHTVAARVVIERAGPDGLTESVPLEQVIVLGEGNPLQSLELRFDSSLGPSAIGDVLDIDELSQQLAFWRPVLRSDEEVVRGDWFTAAGLLEAPVTTATGGALSEGTTALDALGPESTIPEPDDSQLSAAWIEYEITSPGRSPRIERRELFDLIGAERYSADGDADLPLVSTDDLMRRGRALLGTTTILVQGATPHPDAIVDAYLRTWAEGRNALIAMTLLAAGSEDDRILPALTQFRRPPVALLAMTTARDRWATSPESRYLGRPNIWSQHVLVESDAGNVIASNAVDIVVNEIEVLPRPGTNPALARLEQGVLDTLVEQVVSGEPEGINTWARFDQRTPDDAEWVVWRTADEIAGPVAEALPPDDISRIRASLEAGHVVIVAPEPRVRGGEMFVDWWRVSPDGATLGMGFRGWGAEVAEKVAVDIQVDSRVVAAFKEMMQKSQCKGFEMALTAVDIVVTAETGVHVPTPPYPGTCGGFILF